MPRLSARAERLKPSPVRAMLNVSLQPDVISFAGGLPDFESFADLELPEPPRRLLQYGPTEGEPELREAIARELAGLGLDVTAERVMVLSGSQQGIDLAAKLFVDPGSRVALESPAYLAALQVFEFFGAAMEPFDRTDPAARWREPPALLYITPTFQNPTGACWTAAERRAVADAALARDIVIFEDDPYRDLVYQACDRRPVCADAKGGSWIYQSSFSKTVAPGLRLGYLAASPDLFPKLVMLKQAADLHANRLSQWTALRYLSDPGRPDRLKRIVATYKAKRDRFDEALRRHIGNRAQWTPPPGGLFFWLSLGRAAPNLVERALERGVLFTSGEHFLVDPADAPAMRLNFSLGAPEAPERGLAILGEVLEEVSALA
jgi:2-aminoadipate transaminase